MGVIIPQVVSATEDRASGALVVDGSLKFDKNKSQHLKRTFSTGNRTTWTWSGWIKRSTLGGSANQQFFSSYTDGNNLGFAYFTTADIVRFDDYQSANIALVRTIPVYRDPSAWYHLTIIFDSTQSTSSDRVRIYINGTQVRDITSPTYPNSNTAGYVNNASAHYIGQSGGSSEYFDGEMSQVYFIDGQALDPSYFGYTDPLTNTWRPKKLTTWSNPNGDGVTWSGFLTNQYTLYNNGSSGDGSNGFDYSLSTYAMDWNGIYNSNYSYRLEFIPTTPISFTSQVRVYTEFNPSSPYSNNFYVDTGSGYGSAIPHVQNSWVTVATGPGQLYKLKSTGVQNGTGWNAIQIDGVILVNGANRWGQNGFYLPLDGNTPIGQDMSGRGNNWTPVNFGGSNTLEKATGALPILNTDGGGKVARVGVRTDSSVGVGATCVLALPLVGIKSDFSNKVDSRSTEKVITATNSVASNAQSVFYGGSWYFDGTADSLAVSSSSDLTLGNTWTIEFWFYNAGSGGAADARLYYFHSNTNNLQTATTGTQLLFYNGSSSTTFGNINLNTWVHVAAVNSSGTVRFYINGVQNSSTTSAGTFSGNQALTIGAFSDGTSNCFTGYIQDFRIYNGVAKYTQNFIPASTDPDILPDTPSGVAYSSNVALVPSTDGAVAFDGSGDFLSLTPTDTLVNSTSYTIEGFILATSTSGTKYIWAASDNLGLYILNGSIGWESDFFSSIWGGSSFRTPIATNKWYHIAAVRNSSDNSIKFFVDGNLINSITSSTTATAETNWRVGANQSDQYFSGFVSNFHIVKGTALYTSNFTPPTAPISSVANTKLLCCKSNSSATAFDVSPGSITANGNTAASNFNPFTVNINTQRGQESGYATMSPLFLPDGHTFANGNLTVTTSTNAHQAICADVAISSGKWYWEYSWVSGPSGNLTGIWKTNDYTLDRYVGGTSSSYGYYSGDGNKYNNSSASSYGSSWTTGDVIGNAFDADNGTITFYKNGISQGVAYSSIPVGINTSYFPAFSKDTAGTNTTTASLNFGQKPFKFPPPAGFQPLALANTPRPTIVRPDQYVGVATFTGTGGTQSIITGFKPDLVWVKGRTAADNHSIFDSVRGVGNYLASNSTGAEGNNASSLTSFNRDGFTSGGSVIGGNGTNYVAWAWKAGGNSNTFNINDIGYSTASAAGLTAGTITPTGASVNTKSGFSIIGYNGVGTNSALTSTISHGLTQAPTFMIVKARTGTNAADDWFVYHKSVGPTKRTRLNLTNAADTQPWMGDTEPTSSLITLNQGWYSVNYTGHTHILYAWHDVPGFSKFGSYSGTGVAGNFVYTGFRPKWIMIKNYSGGTIGNWGFVDSTRSYANVANHTLAANLSNAESYFGGGESVFGSANKIDLVSNGFVLREGNAWANETSTSYIYAAFAESPSFNLYGGQSNAR